MGEGSHGELGDEDGAGGVEAFDYLGVFVEGLGFEAGRTPGCGVAFDGEEVFGAPGNAVEGAARFVGGEFVIGGGGLGEGSLFSEGDDEVEGGVVALEACQVELGEVDGGELAGAEEFA